MGFSVGGVVTDFVAIITDLGPFQTPVVVVTLSQIIT